MGFLNWSTRPELNGVADPQIPAMDGASARCFPAMLRSVMSEVARHASDQGGALKTGGAANAYVVFTASGVSTLREGIRLIIRPDRENTDAPTLNVDGTGPKPWLDAGGLPIAVDGILPGRVLAVTYDAGLDAWRLDGALALGNAGLAAMPGATLKGNAGSEPHTPADLTVTEARTLLSVDHLPNKSEDEMVASGPISDALALKATPADITAALEPVIADVASKATPADVSAAVAPVASGVSALQTGALAQSGRITLLETGQKSDRITRGTWADISALTLSADATYEVLDRDTGTHVGISTEDGYSNGRVPNSGIFIPQGSPLVLRRIGGTSVGAIPDLVLDRDTLRAGRYVSRPAEDVRAWTTEIHLPPGAAPPLTLAAPYAVGDSRGGKALLLTGAVGAGPIALTRIEPGVTSRIGPIRLMCLTADPAGTTARIRARCFSNAGTDLNLKVIADVPMAADGLVKTLGYTVSTVAGAADVLFPDPEGGWLRPYVGGSGTTGVLALIELPRPAPPVDVASELAAAEAITTPASDDVFVMRRKSDGKVVTLSLAAFEAAMREPPTYYFPASGRFGAAEATTIIPALSGGAKIAKATFKCESAEGAYMAVAFGGQRAALNSPGSYTFPAGAGDTYFNLPPGPVSVITSRSDTPVTCDLWSTVNFDPSANLRSDKHLARYSAINFSDAAKKSLGDFYNYLYNDKWIELCAGDGHIWVGRAPNNFDGLIDWANPRSLGRVVLDGAAVPDTSLAGTAFNGSNAIDTLTVPTAARASRHTYLTWADTTIQDSLKNAAGSSSLKANINRSPVISGFTSGGAAIIVSGVSPGGLQGFRREGSALTYFRNDTLKSPFTQAPGTSLGSASPYIGALHTPSGLVQGYTGTLELNILALNGVATDDQVNRLYAAFSTCRTALGA